MPTIDNSKLNNLSVVMNQLDEILKAAIKPLGGFSSTLRSLEKGRIPTARQMMTVVDGVVEEKSPGVFDAALQTDQGPLLLTSVQHTNQSCPTPKIVVESAYLVPRLQSTSADLLSRVKDAGSNPTIEDICEVEITRFNREQLAIIRPVLWQYFLTHRNSNNPEDLIAVASAIRKYIATMPMSEISDLADLLDPTQRFPLSLDLELEIVKMIYRCFEAIPPVSTNANPLLSARLWEIAKDYSSPRMLLRDKYSAVASLAIESLVAMQSEYATSAWQLATASPHQWFAEMVSDDLATLRETWLEHGDKAVAWLDQLRSEAVSVV